MANTKYLLRVTWLVILLLLFAYHTEFLSTFTRFETAERFRLIDQDVVIVVDGVEEKKAPVSSILESVTERIVSIVNVTKRNVVTTTTKLKTTSTTTTTLRTTTTVKDGNLWTDLKFNQLLKQGCKSLLQLYEPNMVHGSGYPLAYSLLVHQNASEVERLIRSVYRPYYVFSIHVDNKPASADTFSALQSYAHCFDNILLVEDRVSIHYAGYSRLEADIRCMRQLLSVENEWGHLTNLCGRDFPIQTNDNLEKFAAALGVRSDITTHETTPDHNKYKRIEQSQYQSGELTKKKRTKLLKNGYRVKQRGWSGKWIVADERNHMDTYPYAADMPIYNGMAYNVYSRDFLKWALNDEKARKLFDWSLDTYSPDEHVWATLIRMREAPGAINKSMYTHARFVLWKDNHDFVCHGHFRHSICVFEQGDVEYLLERSNRLFANKFDCNNINSQAAVALIEESRNDRVLGSIGTTSSCPNEQQQFPVDAVYTWVNGSDPAFLSSINTTNLGVESHPDDTKAQRFEDFNQLKYSIRSIEQFAPWIRKIWIVTNGQHVKWLDEDNEHIEIVTHNQIYPNTSHLPTFSSRSIETHLHRIPGITENFLYFNDDFTLTNPTCLDDFWSEEDGYKLYTSSELSRKPLSEKCSELCIKQLISNGECNVECNTLACLWDGNDCDGVDAPNDKDKRPTYFKALDFVHTLYEVYLQPNGTRYKMPHMPLMINREIMSDLQETFPLYYDITSSHRKRQKNDMQFEFSYANWLLGAPHSPQATLKHSDLYKSSRKRTNTIFYMPFYTKMAKNEAKLDEFNAKRDHIKFLCINDLMDHSDPATAASKQNLTIFYENIYANKSKFEL